MTPEDVIDQESAGIYADFLTDSGDDRGSLLYRIVAAKSIGEIQNVLGMPNEDNAILTLHRPMMYEKVADKVRCAESLLSWWDENKSVILEREREKQRIAKCEELAGKGDHLALLAIPDARMALIRLLEGRAWSGRKITHWTKSKAAIRKAKEIIASRINRTQQTHSETMRAGRYREMWLGKLRKRALEWAYSVHANTPLFVSKRGEIEWGRGGKEVAKYLYGRSWKSRPARWRNAGCRFDNEENPTTVIVENHLGNVKARIAVKDLPKE